MVQEVQVHLDVRRVSVLWQLEAAHKLAKAALNAPVALLVIALLILHSKPPPRQPFLTVGISRLGAICQPGQVCWIM